MGTISYDSRSFIINGKRQLLISGSVHYPRSTPAQWPRILDESKAAGLNCIDTYVFWEAHEPQEGQYDFEGRYDICRFLDLCKERGLYVILRVGPYVCAEWNFGGFPWWLISKPGLVTRTWNRPYMEAVAKWVSHLIRKVRDYQITHDGPIILTQMENEYINVASAYGKDGQRYLKWMNDLGRAGFQVPLIMCEGSAEGAIETVNGFSTWARVGKVGAGRSDQPGLGVDESLSAGGAKNQPTLWTENWPAWYDTWCQPRHDRPIEDLTYETLRFFAAGGAGVNYYMWHGGPNFGRDGMYMIATSYEFGGLIDEYGLPTEKTRIMGSLHKVLHDNSSFLLEGEQQPVSVLAAPPDGSDAESTGIVQYSYAKGAEQLLIVANGSTARQCASIDSSELWMPPRSAVILKKVGDEPGLALFRTWSESVKPIVRTMTSKESLQPTFTMIPEPLPGTEYDSDRQFIRVGLPHNMLLNTRDETDYGWYRTRITAAQPQRYVLRARAHDILSVWVNGKYISTGPQYLPEDRLQSGVFEREVTIPLAEGANDLALLVVAMGLIKGDWMINQPQSFEAKGLVSRLTLDGHSHNGPIEFSPGLWGERALLGDGPAARGLPWAEPSGRDTPYRWYRADMAIAAAEYELPEPWALDPGSLFKGMIWINGRCLGRYWQFPVTQDTPVDDWWRAHIRVDGWGEPTQKYYHVPTDWLKVGRNEIVIFEERGALPTGCKLVRRK
jgi:hypothetical protein